MTAVQRLEARVVREAKRWVNGKASHEDLSNVVLSLQEAEQREKLRRLRRRP